MPRPDLNAVTDQRLLLEANICVALVSSALLHFKMDRLLPIKPQFASMNLNAFSEEKNVFLQKQPFLLPSRVKMKISIGKDIVV